MFEKICIIGCGLIGSSILRNVYNSKISKSVTVFDNSREVIEIITGKLNLRSEIDNDWKIIKEGMEFKIPKNSSFKVKVIELVNYTCSYFND